MRNDEDERGIDKMVVFTSKTWINEVKREIERKVMSWENKEDCEKRERERQRERERERERERLVCLI